MSPPRLPAEVAYFVPEPVIILFGCRPLVPYQPGWHDKPSPDQHYRAPARAANPGDRPWPVRICPACKCRIGKRGSDLDHRVYCELCGTMDAHNEANALAQRIHEQATSQCEAVKRKVSHALESSFGTPRHRPRLSESDRRRIWNGYKGGILSPSLEVTNRAKIGREFLNSIKQEPDWSLILDGSGRVVGRHPPMADEC